MSISRPSIRANGLPGGERRCFARCWETLERWRAPDECLRCEVQHVLCRRIGNRRSIQHRRDQSTASMVSEPECALLIWPLLSSGGTVFFRGITNIVCALAG